MTALVIENLKLIMLFLLIGSIVGLSHLGSGVPTKMNRKPEGHLRREIELSAQSVATAN